MGKSLVLHSDITYQHFEIIDSTNAFLMQSEQPINQLVSADKQSTGKGRRKQKWVDEGTSLLFSLSTQFDVGIDFSAWPLQVAISLIETLLAMTSQRIKIKWPNDLYTQNASGKYGKCAGILAESSLGKTGKMVTGVGLNFAPLSHPIASDYPISHLSIEKDKKDCLFILSNALYEAWKAFLSSASIDPKTFAKYDYLAGNMLIATDTNTHQQTIGQAVGVNHKGQLLIQQHGRIATLTSQQKIRLI